jgi:hypothetical protein
MDVLWISNSTFSTLRNVCVFVCVCACVCVCVCGVCFASGVCFARAVLARAKSFQSLLDALACKAPKLSISAPPLAIGHIFDPQEHTNSIFAQLSCVCIDGILNLQHAQHGAQNDSLKRDGRLARILSHVFDLQEHACSVHLSCFYF